MSNTNLTNHCTLKTNSNPISRQDFTIGDNALVIDMLINKYKYPIRTCVQEYLCNARDAMREVGNTNPIEVTAPSRLNSVFKVRDFGPGLSEDRVKNIFTVFGNSTKRKTAKQTGGFGIGAKSAWAYTDAFTIVTYVNGKERHYIAHRGTNRGGALDLVYQGDTKLPNGTEIQIAVNPNDITEFKDAITRATYFWKHKVVLKGNIDREVKDDGIKAGKYLELFTDDQNSSVLDDHCNLVIDGVLYPLDRTYRDKIESLHKLYSKTKSFTLTIGNEIVEVLPSREDIANTEYTIKNLTAICNQALSDYNQYTIDQFKKVTSPFEFVTTYRNLAQIGTVSSQFAKWQHYSIEGYPNRIVHPNFNLLHISDVSNRTRSRRRSDTKIKCDEDRKYIQMDEINRLYYTDIEETVVQRNKRLRNVMAKGDLDILLINKGSLTTTEFRKFIKLFKVKPISSLPLPLKAASVPRVVVARDKKQFCMHLYDSWGTNVKWNSLSEVKTNHLYIEHGVDRVDLKALAEFLSELNFTLVGLSKVNLDRIKGNKYFKSLDSFLKTYNPSKDIAEAHLKRQYSDSFTKAYTNLIKFDIPINSIKHKDLKRSLIEYDKIANIKVRYVPKIILDKVKGIDLITTRILTANSVIDELERLCNIAHNVLTNGYSSNKDKIQDAIDYLNFKQRKNNA